MQVPSEAVPIPVPLAALANDCSPTGSVPQRSGLGRSTLHNQQQFSALNHHGMCWHFYCSSFKHRGATSRYYYAHVGMGLHYMQLVV